MIVDGNTLRGISRLVYPNQPICEFEHIVSERDDNELCVLCSVLDVVGDDGDISEV